MPAFSLNKRFVTLVKELMFGGIPACQFYFKALKQVSLLSLYLYLELWFNNFLVCFMTLILHFRQRFMCPIGSKLDLDKEPTSKWNYSVL